MAGTLGMEYFCQAVTMRELHHRHRPKFPSDTELRWGICGAGLISNDFVTALETLPHHHHKVSQFCIT